MKHESKAKIIFHIDMNMFFCSVAVINHPSLKGKAFAIGRENTTKGVISTASYEARKYGIRSAMPISDAFRLKPDLIVIESDFEQISLYHRRFVNLIKEYTSLVEVASVDEVYADMTEISKTRNAIEVAKEIQLRLVKEYKLPCSIGIAPTLFLAKMASDMKKPLGLVILRKRDKEEKLYPLGVDAIFGLGKKRYPILIENGIKTIGQVMDERNKERVIELLGENTYQYIYDAVNGNSSDIVMPHRYAKNESISSMQTFDNYLETSVDILQEMRIQAKDLVKRLVSQAMMAKTASITLRNEDFKTITRSKTVDYSDDFFYLFDVITDLVDENYTEGEKIRLVGVGFSNLKNKDEVLKEEYNLFTYESFIEREDHLKNLIKEFQKKYGESFIHLGKNKK